MSDACTSRSLEEQEYSFLLMLAYVIGSLVGVTVHHSQPVQNQHLDLG
jgi:hypothetical protein